MEKNIHTEGRENIRFFPPQRYYENKNISKFEHFMSVEHWPKCDSARAVFLALRRQLFSFIPCLMVKDTKGGFEKITCKVCPPPWSPALYIHIYTKRKKTPTWCTEH